MVACIFLRIQQVSKKENMGDSNFKTDSVFYTIVVETTGKPVLLQTNFYKKSSVLHLCTRKTNYLSG